MSWVFNPPNCSSTCSSDNDGGFDDHADNSNDIAMVVMLMIMELKKEFSNPPKSSSCSHMCSNKPDALGLHVASLNVGKSAAYQEKIFAIIETSNVHLTTPCN